MYVSANGGVNWSALATPPGGANNGGVNSVIVTPRRIFAATESGVVYFSTDAGAGADEPEVRGVGAGEVEGLHAEDGAVAEGVGADVSFDGGGGDAGAERFGEDE